MSFISAYLNLQIEDVSQGVQTGSVVTTLGELISSMDAVNDIR